MLFCLLNLGKGLFSKSPFTSSILSEIEVITFKIEDVISQSGFICDTII